MSEAAQTQQRQKRIVEPEEVLAKVTDGMTIAIGGFINSSHPMLVVRGLIKRGVKNLTVVGAASSGLETDLLIAAGCARKVVAPYVGGEALAPIGPAFRAAAEKGQLEVFELDEAMYYAALRAAAQRVPFNPWRSGVGTSFPEMNPAIKTFQDPINGETLLAIPAINISETALSFLGLGLRPPAISWGVLLQDAQNIQALVISPWLLYPSVAVIVAVLAFNFMGDGIRDAADPYL